MSLIGTATIEGTRDCDSGVTADYARDLSESTSGRLVTWHCANGAPVARTFRCGIETSVDAERGADDRRREEREDRESIARQEAVWDLNAARGGTSV